MTDNPFDLVLQASARARQEDGEKPDAWKAYIETRRTELQEELSGLYDTAGRRKKTGWHRSLEKLNQN